jgi:hypothetical protein
VTEADLYSLKSFFRTSNNGAPVLEVMVTDPARRWAHRFAGTLVGDGAETLVTVCGQPIDDRWHPFLDGPFHTWTGALDAGDLCPGCFLR